MTANHRFVTAISNRWVRGSIVVDVRLALTFHFQLNILVSSSHRAIITDFGSARAVRMPIDGATGGRNGLAGNSDINLEENRPGISILATGNQLTLTGPAWSLRWASPEVVNGSNPSLPSDIWSAGWVCWEVSDGVFNRLHRNR